MKKLFEELLIDHNSCDHKKTDNEKIFIEKQRNVSDEELGLIDMFLAFEEKSNDEIKTMVQHVVKTYKKKRRVIFWRYNPMCGIVGYIGSREAKEVILDGLKRLEYRGYDSAGMSLFNMRQQIFDVYKDQGRVDVLVKSVENSPKSNIGIGHTRWATHGKVNKENAHPHYSHSRRFILVHNGVIENYQQLKRPVPCRYGF